MGEECLKSADSAAAPLRRLMVRYSLPPGTLESLQAAFPDIEFIQAEDAFVQLTPLGDVDAVVTWNLAEDEIAAAPNLRWVQWIGAGVDHAPLAALRNRGILLTNNRGVHANNIAEHVIGMMISLARNFPNLVRAQDQHVWKMDEERWNVKELAGSRLVVLGAGNLGSAIARKAAGLDLDVVVLGRNPRETYLDRVTYRTIDALDAELAEADHVVICTPLTDETRGLIDADRIARVKPGAYLYNVGRGPIVDTDALVAALQSGQLGAAALDVTDPEPLPAEHPLWDLPNVFITGHTSGATPHYWDRAARILEGNIRHYLAGEPLDNLVDYDLGY
ncbi:MAG: D-2-hydroxyacid dehydrogenase [Thermomicrobiales bacterium]|nr:D-2-hydroxyacid dehydrogenase [Thermomicrobiales bacterium]MCO5221633.1 D-2-hydroxyacid dehydrogenase [Thermomicrobiales bacterium]